MPQQIEFDGAVHEFPDDFTEADIQKALKSEPKTGVYSSPGRKPGQQEKNDAYVKANTPAPTPGILSSFANATGIPDLIQSIGEQHQRMQTQPMWDTIKDEASMMNPVNLIKGVVGQTVKTGKTVGNQLAEGNYSGAAGSVAGAIAPILIPEAIDRLPSTARAGRNFETVRQAVGNAPVNTPPILQTAQEGLDVLKNRTGSGNAMLEHILKTGGADKAPLYDPIPFDVSREMQSGLGERSVMDRLFSTPSKTKVMAKTAGELAKANDAAAESAGVGPLYRDAMSEYKNAARLKSLGKKAAVVGIGAAGGGALYNRMKNLGLPLP